MDYKKGLIYTIVLFFLLSATFELVSYTASHEDRQLEYFLPIQSGQMVAYRIDELSRFSLSSLGIGANMQRNSTQLTLTISDFGFPLADSTDGKVLISPLKNWTEENWSNFTNCPASLNVSIPNQMGIVLMSSQGMNYTQNNSNLANDSATLSIPFIGISNLTSISASIYCIPPSGSSSISYSDWQADGGEIPATILFSDSGGESHLNSISFNPDNDHLFAAKYFDANPFWIETFHADWIRPNYTLRIWSEVNSSYIPAITKQNVSCTWNISASLNYSNAGEEALFIPMNTSLTCQNSSYFGPLVLYKK